MDLGLVVIIAIVAFLVGIFCGFLVSKATSGGDRSGNLKNQMDSLQERFSDYQTEVVNHFNKTTDIVQKFSQNYQEMQTYLEHSVETLVSDSELRAKLLSEIKVSDQKSLEHLTEGVSNSESLTSEPVVINTYSEIPRDYAPKVPGEPGTLAEEFGVKHK